MGFILIIAIALVLTVVGLGVYCVKKGMSGKSAKRILGMNVVSMFGLLVTATILIFSGTVVHAEETAAAAASVNGLGLLAAALSTGLATIGAGIAVAISSSAALGAISEDQSLLGKTLIFVGLSEGIAIYGLIMSIMILGRI